MLFEGMINDMPIRESISKCDWKRYIRKNEIREYLDYRKNQIYSIFLNKTYVHHYDNFENHKVLDFEKTNKVTGDRIDTGKGFWVGRYGMTEMQVMIHTINYSLGLPSEKEKYLKKLCDLSGFFPNKIVLADRFVEVMLRACKELDLHAIWPMNMEDYFIKYLENKNVRLTKLGDLEPWNVYRYPDFKGILWSEKLKGKKVLVIHPFAETIKKQYSEHREDIFSKLLPADKILPQFDLITIKAVQTIAGVKDDRFDTWFDALDFMVNEASKIDFDVAIVGCGAYGFPLCAEIKKMDKPVIHLGGATQLMFGIKGKRWENNDYFRENVMNAFWVRPSLDEMPVHNNKVEDGCYW